MTTDREHDWRTRGATSLWDEGTEGGLRVHERSGSEGSSSRETRAGKSARVGYTIRHTYVFVTVNGLSVPDLYLCFTGNTLFVFNPRRSKNIEEVSLRSRAR